MELPPDDRNHRADQRVPRLEHAAGANERCEFTVDINGVPVRGRYLEVDPPHRLVISWGHAGSTRLPPGASTVEISLTPDPSGTTVRISHRDLPEADAQQHAIGWPHFLERHATAGAGGDPGADPWATA